MDSKRAAKLYHDHKILEVLGQVNNLIQALRAREGNADKTLKGIRVIISNLMAPDEAGNNGWLVAMVSELERDESYRLVRHDLTLEASEHLMQFLHGNAEALLGDKLLPVHGQLVAMLVGWLKTVYLLMSWDGSNKKKASMVKAFTEGRDPDLMNDEERRLWNQAANAKRKAGGMLPSDRAYLSDKVRDEFGDEALEKAREQMPELEIKSSVGYSDKMVPKK